jgi:nicotinate-nucleotide adenylyltransferase
MFDPPHIGHRIVANEAAWQLGLDELHVVVCARPPHRPEGWLPAEFRLQLVAVAMRDDPAIVVSRAELDRPGPSFTVDTLQALADEDPDAELVLIIGADQLQSFGQWYRPERIVELATLAVVARDNADRGALVATARAVTRRPVAWVDIPEIGISSSMIRERLRAGQPYRHLVPEPVADLLAAESLTGPTSTLP